MPVVRFTGGRVTVEDSVTAPRPVAGEVLRDGFFADMKPLTLGLIQVRNNSLWLGRLEMLRFGRAEVGPTGTRWPIDGGLLARAPGGHFRIEAARGRVVAAVDGYRPRLPFPLYAITQLPIHHLVVRLHLLRVRGRRPAVGVPAQPAKRLAAAAIDMALCAAVTTAIARRPRLPVLLGATAAYHVACWSLSGRTLGGLAMNQQLVAIDGSRATVGQAVVRLLALPLAVVRLRAAHDDIACTDVIASDHG
jgi:hypothetical protein